MATAGDGLNGFALVGIERLDATLAQRHRNAPVQLLGERHEHRRPGRHVPAGGDASGVGPLELIYDLYKIHVVS
jgi:hypothetical protein